MASCDANVHVIDITWQKIMFTSFQLSWLKECNGAIFDVIGIMWCQQQCQCCTSFQSSWLNKSSDTDAGVSDITWPKMSFCISFWLYWANYGMVPLMTLFVWYDTDTSINSSIWPKKVMLHFIWTILTNQMQQFPLMMTWHCIMLLLVPVTSHNEICHVVCPFHHPNLTNGRVPLMTLLTSCDTDTSISGITWPK